MSSTTAASVDDEIESVRRNLPRIQLQTATHHFVTAVYEKTPWRRIKLTLTFPDSYPSEALIVVVVAERGVPPGLKKKLEKELTQVAESLVGTHEQVEAVLQRLQNFVDTNRFVPCWKELKQSVDKVQSLAKSDPMAKGSSISMNEVKGLIKLKLVHTTKGTSQYHYTCNVTIDEGYPTTLSIHDWGKACRLQMTSTNFPPKIESVLTMQAQELVKRLQDGMPLEEAVRMSNPIAPPSDEERNKNKDGPQVRLTQQALKGLKHDVETLAHVKELRQVNAATVQGNAQVKAHSAKERKDARRSVAKITESEISADQATEAQWQQEEKERMSGYNISAYDGSNPQPSLLALVNFLIDKIQRLPQQKCPICNETTLPADPKFLSTLYTKPSEKDKKARRLARKRRPMRPYCGCWYHYDCLDKFIVEPPFGAACPHDGRRVYHPDWPADMRELERTWASKQARLREIEDASLFL